MIELAQGTLTINTPVSTIFKYVSNMENYKEWFPGVEEVRSFNELAHGTVGKQYKETLNLNGEKGQLIIEVIQCKPNELFLTQGNLPGILPQMTIRFLATQENGCEMNLQYHGRASELKQDESLQKMLQQDLHKRTQQGLLQLKQLMESHGYWLN
ncbi:MAG: SRPBCC family protein [Bermanella sp.]